MLDRRLSTLQSIDQKITSSATTDDLWHNLAEAMEPNTSDMPFVLLYSAVVNHGQTTGRERSPVAPPLSISLEAAIGEGAEQAAPSSIDLEVDTGLGFYCRDSMVNNKTTRLSAEVLPDELRSVFRSRETAEPCTHAIICPIQVGESRLTLRSCFLANMSSHHRPSQPWDSYFWRRTLVDRGTMTMPTSSVVLQRRRVRLQIVFCSPNSSDVGRRSSRRARQSSHDLPREHPWALHCSTRLATSSLRMSSGEPVSNALSLLILTLAKVSTFRLSAR